MVVRPGQAGVSTCPPLEKMAYQEASAHKEQFNELEGPQGLAKVW